MIIRTMRSTIRPDIGLQSLAQRRGRVASKLKMVCTDNAEYLEITRYRLCGRIRRQYIRYFREQCAHFGGLNLIHCVPDAVHFEVSVAQGYGLLAKVSFSEHRVIPPVVEASSETAATHAGGQFRSRPCELTWIQLRMTRKRTIDWLRVTALSFGIWTRSHHGRNFLP